MPCTTINSGQLPAGLGLKLGDATRLAAPSHPAEKVQLSDVVVTATSYPNRRLCRPSAKQSSE